MVIYNNIKEFFFNEYLYKVIDDKIIVNDIEKIKHNIEEFFKIKPNFIRFVTTNDTSDTFYNIKSISGISAPRYYDGIQISTTDGKIHNIPFPEELKEIKINDYYIPMLLTYYILSLLDNDYIPENKETTISFLELKLEEDDIEDNVNDFIYGDYEFPIQ